MQGVELYCVGSRVVLCVVLSCIVQDRYAYKSAALVLECFKSPCVKLEIKCYLVGDYFQYEDICSTNQWSKSKLGPLITICTCRHVAYVTKTLLENKALPWSD